MEWDLALTHSSEACSLDFPGLSNDAFIHTASTAFEQIPGLFSSFSRCRARAGLTEKWTRSASEPTLNPESTLQESVFFKAQNKGVFERF